MIPGHRILAIGLASLTWFASISGVRAQLVNFNDKPKKVEIDEPFAPKPPPRVKVIRVQHDSKDEEESSEEPSKCQLMIEKSETALREGNFSVAEEYRKRAQLLNRNEDSKYSGKLAELREKISAAAKKAESSASTRAGKPERPVAQPVKTPPATEDPSEKAYKDLLSFLKTEWIAANPDLKEGTKLSLDIGDLFFSLPVGKQAETLRRMQEIAARYPEAPSAGKIKQIQDRLAQEPEKLRAAELLLQTGSSTEKAGKEPVPVSPSASQASDAANEAPASSGGPGQEEELL